ncbi:Mannose-1-phosphate guanylyltransferase [Magnetospirillum molischianum DSM 120]|uniref:mannose-1-phosphate guanylyltransferase n=1 Tax=Magnetospirillum molischianum DSM 120 TaxID=1150626 RepID=H8FX13_MAGML|nr:Mannose-1-phosphate guanylyltransferase [Magnetospirillum molischianum DSM 120]
MLVPTILCGGSGSRLWPVSRELDPKPFIALPDGQTLLQKSYVLGAGLPDVREVITITRQSLFFRVESEIRQLAGTKPDLTFILEPFGRNTAAAVAASALYVAQTHGEDTVQLILAADHLITDPVAFAGAVAQAEALARNGKIVTFGIQPDAPETGYGYIEANGTDILRFVEKPSLEKAEEFVRSGRFFWNSGMFCFTAGTMLRELAEHCPDVLEATRVSIEAAMAATKDKRVIEFDPRLFERVRDTSIDIAVMEKSQRGAVVACDIGWSDIGSWDALSALLPADANGNRLQGDVLIEDSKNCFIQSAGRLFGVLGVEDLIVVDTPDAVLITHKDRTQDVKRLFTELKRRNHESHKMHLTVHRPWGTYTVLDEGERHKIKRITVKPGARLSLQAHHHRSEHWIVVAGMAKVTNGDKEMLVGPNQSTYIPAGCLHRLENPGILDLSMIEVQSGDYLGEDDIVRYEDLYGRC